MKSKNAYFVLTNAAHSNIDKLFHGIGKKYKVNRYSVIGGKGAEEKRLVNIYIQIVRYERRNTKIENLLDKIGILSHLKVRRSEYDYLGIKKSEIQEFIDAGWEIQKTNKNTYRIKRLKKQDIWFEDRVWCLFAKMGFLQMNADRQFRLSYTSDPKIPGKQIDVFAVDEETIFIIECKSSEKRTSTSFQKDINEINGIRENKVKNLRKSFNSKLKIVWLFCTENIVLSENDKGRCLNIGYSILIRMISDIMNNNRKSWNKC